MTRLPREAYARLDDRLSPVDDDLARRYPGTSGERQPVHTLYVPADRFDATLPHRFGAIASAALEEHVPDGQSLATLIGVAGDIGEAVRTRVAAKLAVEPIEDLRIDFEDGYGSRPDPEEDDAATRAGAAVAAMVAAGTAPPFIGLRPKNLERANRHRALRTLDLFLSACPTLPPGLRITLPKVTDVVQVEAFVDVCAALERAHGLPERRLRFEIQIETTQAVLGPDGSVPIARMVHRGAGRVSALHYGTYDYSAACGIAAAYQSLDHPVADHAKAVMQVAAAATGVQVCDGSTNVLPVGGAAAVDAAWRLHARLVRRSLERGFYQGWDLHPAQLVTRYATTYAFYREGLPTAAARLRDYLRGSSAGILDEPATAQAMAALLTRGIHCGALDIAEVTAACGADLATLDRLYRRRVG